MAHILPTRKEWQMIFNMLSRKEKILFLIFFLAAWSAGTLILKKVDSRYSTPIPAQGGTYIEGLIGTPNFINPLLTVSDTDRDLTRVIYAGLMKTDGQGNLVPELAERYEISADGLTYTFYLRDKLTWHDGASLMADDVAFTVNLAKNPAIRSPRLANWEGITPEVVGEREIRFHLKKPYAPFLGNTSLGIIPKHLWDKVTPDAFSRSKLNTEPIGAGPFQIDSIAKNAENTPISYTLKRFAGYKPRPAYLTSVIFNFYPTEEKLTTAMETRIVDAAHIPDKENFPDKKTIDIRLPRIVGLFFNQDSFEPLKDLALRDALRRAIGRNQIIAEAIAGHAIATSLPIPPGTFAYAPSLEAVTGDAESARTILKKAGYQDTDGDGFVEKKSKRTSTPIVITISTLQDPELVKTAQLVRQMWRDIGIDARIQIVEAGNLDQDIIRPRNYNILLFGQVVGYYPDPYAFWHTSQRNHPGLNVALYANTKIDKLLEEARTTVDLEKQKQLYTSFQEELTKDIPAIFLYSPAYVYTVPENLRGLDIEQIPFPQDRFAIIDSWYTQSRNVWDIILKYPALAKWFE